MKAALTAGAITLCVILTGCDFGSAPGGGSVRQGDTATPTTQPSASSTATSQFPSIHSQSSQTSGPCPLTQPQIQAVLGQRIRLVSGCSYRIVHGTGIVGLLTTTYSSPKQAQKCVTEGNIQVARIYPGAGTRIIKLRGLDGQAEVAIQGRSGALAVLLRGTKQLLVAIFWPPAAAHPQLAITLLREASVNFDSYSSPEVLGCG